MLAYHAWLKLGRHIPLYYFEVDLGGQTSLFHPTDYVDVTTTVQAKQDACFCHISQNAAAGFWAGYHEPMLRFRGMESGYKSAEAFVHHSQSGRESARADVTFDHWTIWQNLWGCRVGTALFSGRACSPLLPAAHGEQARPLRVFLCSKS